MNDLIFESFYIALRELKKYFRQKTRIITTIIQPFIWLALMGNTMSGLTANPMAEQFLGTGNYLTFMTPGVILMTLIFSSIFSGTSIVWDRRIGYLDKLLAAPINRGAIPFGKIIAAAVQGAIQAIIIVAIAMLFGVKFKTGILGILVILIIGILISIVIASLSLFMAAKIKTIETLMAVVNLITMPLLFSSNALFPTQVMPKWLQAIAKINPISYAVSPMRSLTVSGWEKSILLNISIILFIDIVALIFVNFQFKNIFSE